LPLAVIVIGFVLARGSAPGTCRVLALAFTFNSAVPCFIVIVVLLLIEWGRAGCGNWLSSVFILSPRCSHAGHLVYTATI